MQPKVDFKLSIAICADNRPDVLRNCLGALGDLGYHLVHQVVVVDNSDDAVHRLANEKLVQSWPGVRYSVSEPPSLSRARSLALAQTSGDLVAFLDDDATCQGGWAEALMASFSDGDVVCAGGPIQPNWENPPPAWLGGELLQPLAILDLGDSARDLTASEFFYGANIAFRRTALQAVGGFAEQVGQTNTDPMGDQDIEVQRRLRERGCLRYTPGAKVRHLIRSERCSAQWFLKRYAWQSGSDARTPEAGTLAYLATLLQLQGMPSAADRIHEHLATEPGSLTEQAVARAQFVRGLAGTLLNGCDPAPRMMAVTRRRRTLEAPEFESFKCQVPGETEYLFLEFGVAHAYLFGAYGEIKGSSLLNPQLDPGRQPKECAEFVRNALFYAGRTGVKAVVLITADVLLCPDYEEILGDSEREVAVFGFLHRVPRDAASGEQLQRRCRNMEGLFVYSEPVQRYLEAQYGLTNVIHVPHPPVFLANVPVRAARRLPASAASDQPRLGLGLLGEVRPEKGYEFVIDALSTAAFEVRSRIKIVMAGAVDAEVERRIQATCAAACVVTEFNLRSPAARGYRAVPDNVFIQALLDSDVIVMPYEAGDVFSGHFVDALRAGSWFLVTRDSAIGSLVDRHSLGETFERGDRRSFLAALDTLLERIASEPSPGPERLRLAEACSTAKVCRQVEEALGKATTARAAGRLPSYHLPRLVTGL